MKLTGELLKSERARKSLSIQDVAFSLKLSPKIIQAIEAGELESLPAKTFIRGFVKSYSQYLKMDVDQVMRQFHEEMGSTQPVPRGESAKPTQAAASNAGGGAAVGGATTAVLDDSKSNRTLMYIGFAVVLVVLIVATNRVVDRYQKESILNPQDISKVQPLEPAPTKATPEAQTQPQSQAQSPTQTPTQAQVEPAAGSATAPAGSALPATSNTATSTANLAEVEDGFEVSSGKPVEVMIEAKKETEIMYARGNTKIFSRLHLVAKQVQVIRSTTGLHLKAEDGGAFNLVVNGVEKGPGGANNKAVKLSF